MCKNVSNHLCKLKKVENLNKGIFMYGMKRQQTEQYPMKLMPWSRRLPEVDLLNSISSCKKS